MWLRPLPSTSLMPLLPRAHQPGQPVGAVPQANRIRDDGGSLWGREIPPTGTVNEITSSVLLVAGYLTYQPSTRKSVEVQLSLGAERRTTAGYCASVPRVV